MNYKKYILEEFSEIDRHNISLGTTIRAHYILWSNIVIFLKPREGGDIRYRILEMLKEYIIDYMSRVYPNLKTATGKQFQNCFLYKWVKNNKSYNYYEELLNHYFVNGDWDKANEIALIIAEPDRYKEIQLQDNDDQNSLKNALRMHQVLWTQIARSLEDGYRKTILIAMKWYLAKKLTYFIWPGDPSIEIYSSCFLCDYVVQQRKMGNMIHCPAYDNKYSSCFLYSYSSNDCLGGLYKKFLNSFDLYGTAAYEEASIYAKEIADLVNKKEEN